MKHCIILGTRPEMIKLSPVIRALQARHEDFFLLHTNQHYTPSMDAIFSQQLELPRVRYNLNVGSGSDGHQTGKMLIGIERVLQKERPTIAYIQGDTNTVLAGAVTAAKMGVRVAHVEAGLRSYDRSMPEELNRIVADHLSDYLFAPTEQSATTAKNEGIVPQKVFVVGNTIVDAIQQNLTIAEKQPLPKTVRGLDPGGYLLLTLHRPANVDNKAALQEILHGLHRVGQAVRKPFIFPIHPRTAKQLEKFHLVLPPSISAIEPVGFLEMLLLESRAFMIFTDSGGIQEEACILKKKCVTLRNNTERPETLEVGGNILAGVTSDGIVGAAEQMWNRNISWRNPFGDGGAGEKIINICREEQQV